MKHLKKAFLILFPGVGLLLFLSATNPYEAPLPLLLVPFVLLFWFAYIISKSLLSLIIHSRDDAKEPQKTDRKKTKLSITSAILTSIIVLITVLQSIQQLTVRDMIITTGLVVVTVFYIKRLS